MADAKLLRALYRSILRWTRMPNAQEQRFIVPLLAREFAPVRRRDPPATTMAHVREVVRRSFRSPSARFDDAGPIYDGKSRTRASRAGDRKVIRGPACEAQNILSTDAFEN